MKMEQLKIEVRSLLVSSTQRTSVSTLLKDYETFVGSYFPHNRLGYSQPIDLLREMTDVVTIYDDPKFGPVVQPINNERSLHIQQLVQTQKKPRGKFNYRSPGNFHNFNYQKRNYVPRIPQPTFSPQNKPQISAKQPELSWNGRKSPQGFVESNTSQVQEDVINHSSDQTQPVDYDKPEGKKDFEPIEPAFTKVSSSGRGSLKSFSGSIESMPEVSRTIHKSSHKNMSVGDFNTLSDLNCTYVSTSHRQSRKDNLSAKMKANFYTILEEHLEGIPLSKFVYVYKERFGAPLHIPSLGFSSPREMVMQYPNIFAFEKTKTCQEWILYDARINPKKRIIDDDSTWLPNMVSDNLASISQEYPQGIIGEELINLYEERFDVRINYKVLGFETVAAFLAKCPCVLTKEEGEGCIVYPKNWGIKKLEDPAPAMPTVEELKHIWEPYFREDICDVSFQYNHLKYPTQGHIKVTLADVYAPDRLWVHLHEKNFKLIQLMYELNNFYDANEEDYKLNPVVIKPGLACVIKFEIDQRWHRAKVRKYESDTVVMVDFVDYGTENKIDISEIRGLHKRFSELPVFAIRSSLYGLAPVGDGIFCVNSSRFLYESFGGRALFARIVKASDEVPPSLELLMCDTSGEEDVNINESLITNGYAVWAATKVENPKKRHVLHENNVRLFYHFLPTWLYESEISAVQDVINATEALETCISNEIRSVNIEDASCCKKHILQAYFASKPVKAAKMWKEILSNYSSQLEDNMLSKVLEDSEAKELQSKLLMRSCATIKMKENFKKEFGIKKDQNVDAKIASETENLKNKTDQTNLPPKSNSKRRKKKSVLEAIINDEGTKICLILYKNDVYVIYQQLVSIFAKGLPEYLINHRLQMHAFDPKFVQIDSKEEPSFFTEIGTFYETKRTEIVLLPLALVSPFLHTIAPAQYSKQCETLEMLAGDCKPDHEFWTMDTE